MSMVSSALCDRVVAAKMENDHVPEQGLFLFFEIMAVLRRKNIHIFSKIETESELFSSTCALLQRPTPDPDTRAW